MSAGYRIGSLTRQRPDGTSYRHCTINWTDERGTHRVSLGTDDRAAAEAQARSFWASRRVAGTDTVGEIVTAWLEATPMLPGAKRSREAWTAAATYWRRIRPGLVDKAMCQDYARQRGRAANTVRNELSTIRSALKWAKAERLIETSPTLWMPPIPDSAVEHLSKAEFKLFLAGCSAPHVVLFAQLAVLTGARATALLQLPWDRVDIGRRLLNLNPRWRQQIANKRRAVVTINDTLLPLLTEARDAAQTAFVIEYRGGPIKAVKTAFAAASKRSRVECHPHMLRHTAAVWMAEARVPMEEIAAYLGHTNIATTAKVYARFSPDYLQRAGQALTW